MALDGFEGGFRIGGRCITNLRYADDIVLIARSEKELQQLVNRVHEAAGDMNMKINVKKTEVKKKVKTSIYIARFMHQAPLTR